MFKSLSRWFRALFIGREPTALEVMKKSMYHAEMSYLATLDEKEYHACMAEMRAVEARHDYDRCLRLQKFIKQEERSQAEMVSTGIDERALEVLLAAVATDLNSLFPEKEKAVMTEKEYSACNKQGPAVKETSNNKA